MTQFGLSKSTMICSICFLFQEKTINPSTTNGMPANSMVGMTETNSSANGLNARQMMVFNLIRASTLEQGISKQDMYGSLKDRMSQVEFE